MTESTLGTQLGSIITALQAQYSPANIVTIVSTVLGATLGMTVLWFGIRYAIGKVKKAFTRGRA